MSFKCQLTGKNRNVANNVSHANNKNKTTQKPNLRTKKLWVESQKRYIRVRLSARALRTVTKKGLESFLRDAGMTLKDIS